MLNDSPSIQYALVAYLRGPLGQFVEKLRTELYADHAHLAAHVTVLPPRKLQGSEADAIRHLQQVVNQFVPFEVEFADVQSFAPATAAVFLGLSKSAQCFRDMHKAFNSGVLLSDEQWPFVPHLTIAHMPDLAGADQALEISRERWK